MREQEAAARKRADRDAELERRRVAMMMDAEKTRNKARNPMPVGQGGARKDEESDEEDEEEGEAAWGDGKGVSGWRLLQQTALSELLKLERASDGIPVLVMCLTVEKTTDLRLQGRATPRWSVSCQVS